MEKYGQDMIWLDSGNDLPERYCEYPNPMTPEKTAENELKKMYVATMQPTTWSLLQNLEHEEEDGSQPLVKSGFLDCIFPFDSQANLSQIRTGQKIPKTWLPPGTKISITLRKRWPIEQALERMDVTDAIYYSVTNPNIHQPNRKFPRRPVKVEIEEMVINYDSIVLKDDSVLRSLMSKGAEYWQDSVTTHLRSCIPSTNYDEMRYAIGKGVKQAIMTFAPEHALIPDLSKRQWLSSRLHWPPNLTSIQVSLVGRDNIIANAGLVHVNDEKRNSSFTVKALLDEYRKEGLFEKDYDAFQPKTQAAVRCYNNALLIDISQYNAMEPQEILFACNYQGEKSYKNWLGVCYAIGQKKITWSKNKGWEIVNVE